MIHDEPNSCCHSQQSKDDLNHLYKENISQYICPMHPEIISDRLENCSICGMNLEQKYSLSRGGEIIEFLDIKWRCQISAILTSLLFIIAMGPMIPGISFSAVLSSKALGIIEFILATPVVLWSALPFFKKGWNSLISRNLNMFTLVALGVGISYAYSLASLFISEAFPILFQSHKGGHPFLYFESAAAIVTLVLLGQLLELKVRSKTNSAIVKLLDLVPKIAHVIGPTGQEEDIAVSSVLAEQHLRIKPGEKIPVDGIVLEGKSSVDESMITGEPIPILKRPQDHIIAGSINGNGTLIMKAKHVGKDTILTQIIDIVDKAQRSRAPIQKLVDKISSYFVPCVIITAAFTFIVWLFVGPEPKFTYAIINAVAVLVIACPCALGLATPMSIMVGTGQGAQVGVLIKEAEALEKMVKINTLVIDKTGTFTEGKPQVTSIFTAPGFKEDDVLTVAASLEGGSEHPLAIAILNAAQKRHLKLLKVENFESITGKGIIGKIKGKEVAVGNEKLFRDFNINLSSMCESSKKAALNGQTLMFVAFNNILIGFIETQDLLKISAKETLSILKKEDISIIMLTGDRKEAAERVGKQLDIENIISDVLPTEKGKIIKMLQSQGKLVAMVGDGINDAPALATADVGIAMGTGADIAIESADVVLTGGDLKGIIRARQLSKAIVRNIRQNLFLAFIYNLLAMLIAAGVFYPFFGILLNPMTAAAAMSISSIFVISNALRLKKVPLN